ncbi:tetratricopeptide repeat protein [Candidatus Sumerlaeota bacterium]|nr:tetratricopeptide repeat protein [Candidatus Sumerlaeota bacterium]
MADKPKTPETPSERAPESHATGLALLDTAMEQFRLNLSKDMDEAQQRFGFTLFHSLTPQEKVRHLEALGFEPRDGIDHYNLGCVDALQGNFESAIGHFERAVADQPDLLEAVFNLALSLERAGRTPEAKKQWGRALDLTSDEAERREIEAHIAALG